eukprot:6230513-Pyramimonas_sp.AAC.1
MARPVHADNFLATPRCLGEVRGAASRAQAVMAASSLPTHLVEAPAGGGPPSWHFDEAEPLTGLRSRPRWRPRPRAQA